MRNKLKILLAIDIALLLIIVPYKLYLFAFEKDFNSFNIANIEQAQANVAGGPGFSFAVLGKIENSIDVFNKRTIPDINGDNDISFVVSTGDAVLDGAEDKYRILEQSFKRLTAPAIAGIGAREITEGGALRYYEHFGPYYFSFAASDSYFIFLDSTGQSSEQWQREWLLTEMETASRYSHIFVFINKFPDADDGFRDFLTGTFTKYNVDAVFSSGGFIFEETEIGGVKYYVSGGGGGGLDADDSMSFYHYLKVNVADGNVDVRIVKQDDQSNSYLLKLLEMAWIRIHSLFYVNMLNFTLVIGVLALFGILLYIKASKDVDYYRSFKYPDIAASEGKPLKIAMFTNNYLPFIGGVPISIYRLSKGLRARGHTVYIFAPEYPEKSEADPFVIRCKLLTYHRSKVFNYAVVNLFSPKIAGEFAKGGFDLIHVHHPFWMGGKGRRLGKKYGIPVVLTYHTRFDSYYHYIPFMKLMFKNIISHHIIKRFAQGCDAIFAPAETSKEYLSNIGVSRPIEIISTGIDFDDFDIASPDGLRGKYAAPDEVLLCSVSRLSQEKNIFFLIEGLKYIKEHASKPFKCIVIGDGPERGAIEKAISECGLDDTVLLIGNVPPQDVGRYYLASDIFVFASKSETQGMVVLEAMAGRCPVVAVLSSGIEDAVINGYNGYKTEEDARVWGEKAMLLIEDEGRLKEMSGNARRYAEKFSLDEMASRAYETYAKAIMKHKNQTDIKGGHGE